MKYMAAARTDVGIRKKTNQDSCLILSADTDKGAVLLAMICDGMGGLAKGEVASATVIRSFEDWFKNRLPKLLNKKITSDLIKSEWNALILMNNEVLSEYGSKLGIRLGTTVAALLIIEDVFYILNVGDSRVYEMVTGTVDQLTKDQTYVQRELDLGHMTPEEARNSPQKNVLLQCVGASEIVLPDYYVSRVKPGATYMLCSDGFRHVISENELYQYLGPESNHDRKEMGENIQKVIALNESRNEKDNISAILVRADS